MTPVSSESETLAQAPHQPLWVEWLPWIIGGLFAAVVGSFACLRVLCGNTGVFDLASYHSALLTTFKGRFYFSYLYPSSGFLSTHFDPITLVFLPFYAVLGNSAWPVLIFSQAIAVGFGFPAVARLCRADGLSPRLSLLLVAILFFNPKLHNAAMSDFHPFLLCFPLLLWGWVFLKEGRIGAGSLCWVVACLCKENVALTVGALGLVLALEGRKRVGLSWAAAGLVLFVVIVGLVIPSFRQAGEGNIYIRRYSWLGATPLEMLSTLVLKPGFVAATLIGRSGMILAVFYLAMSFGLLPIFSPVRLLADLPDAAILLLANFGTMYELKAHHPTALLAVFCIASSRGLVNLHRELTSKPPRASSASAAHGPPKPRLFALYCAAVLTVAVVLFYRGAYSLPFLPSARQGGVYVEETRKAEIMFIADRIPLDASVSLPDYLMNPIYPFIARLYIAGVPDRAEAADYVIFDTAKGYVGRYFDDDRSPALETLESSPEHVIVYSHRGLIVVHRIKPAPRELWEHGTVLY
ncbi:MAG: DUF2079 domain-containing protein [bacterium]